MSNNYLNTLIKIIDHVSQINLKTARGTSCSLLDNQHKNLAFATCSEIVCKECAFNNSNHKKIHYLITEGNSDG